MTKFLCIVVVSAFMVVVISAIDCNNNVCTADQKQHTLCLYPDPNPAPDCGRVISVDLTQKEKEEFVNAHNYYRTYVKDGHEKRGKPGPQPPASNMRKMYWDDEIAYIAQRWTNQCRFGHDSCRSVSRFYVGQNAAMSSSTGTINTTPSDIVKMWYEEVKNMDRSEVSRLTGKNVHEVGHYTQLVWADTDRVGCGKIVYEKNGWEHYYVICNYGPGGNYINSPVYNISE